MIQDDALMIPQEHFVKLNGKEYKVYPMIIKDYARVDRLFSKINDQYLYLNLPVPLLDENGKEILTSTGKPKYDYTAYNAMVEIFEMALRLPRNEVIALIDLENGVEVLDMFRGISGLKKKIQETAMNQIQQIVSTMSLPALSKTQAKQEQA